jgi:hypothetical protein
VSTVLREQHICGTPGVLEETVMQNTQDAGRRVGEVADLPETRTTAGAPGNDGLAQVKVIVALREIYAELLKQPIPQYLYDLVDQLDRRPGAAKDAP